MFSQKFLRPTQKLFASYSGQLPPTIYNYSGDPKTGHVRFSNGPPWFGFWMVGFWMVGTIAIAVIDANPIILGVLFI